MRFVFILLFWWPDVFFFFLERDYTFEFPEAAIRILGLNPADLDKKITRGKIIRMDIHNVYWNDFFWRDCSKGGLGLSLCKAEFGVAENEKKTVFICKCRQVPVCLHSFQLWERCIFMTSPKQSGQGCPILFCELSITFLEGYSLNNTDSLNL